MSTKSVFKTPEGQALCQVAYDTVLHTWPVQYEELVLQSAFGLTHLLVC